MSEEQAWEEVSELRAKASRVKQRLVDALVGDPAVLSHEIELVVQDELASD